MTNRTVFCLLGYAFCLFHFTGCGKPDTAQSVPVVVNEARLMTGLGHGGKVFAVAISPDSKYILSGSADYTARLWLADTRQEVRRIEGHQGAVTTVGFSPDGKSMLTAGEDGVAYIWNVETGETLHTLVGHKGAILGAKFSPDNNIVATAGEDHTARLWNLTTAEVRILQTHQDFVESIDFSKDGKQVVTSSLDRTVATWDALTGKLLHRAEVHDSEVWDAIFTPRGNIVSTGADRNIKMWNIPHKDSVATYLGYKGVRGGVESLSISHDGTFLVAGGRDRSVYVWSAKDAKFKYEMKGHTEPVWSVAIAPNNRFAVSGSGDKSVRIWSLEKGNLIGELGEPVALAVEMATSPSQMVTWRTNRTISVWQRNQTKTFALGKGANAVAKISPNGQYLFISDTLNTATLWNVQNQQAMHTFKNISPISIKRTAISPSGLLAFGEMDGTVRLVQANGSLLRRLGNKGGAANHVAFSPDGNYLAAGRSDRSLLVLNVQNGNVIQKFSGLKSLISEVAISNNGNFIAAATKDSSATIWDVSQNKQVAQVKGKRPLEKIAFSADNKLLLTTDTYGETTIWSSNGSKISTLAQLGITNATFSADGRFVLTGNMNGDTMLWKSDTGEQAFILRALPQNQWAILNPESKFVSSNNGNLTNAYWVENGQVMDFQAQKNEFHKPELTQEIWN